MEIQELDLNGLSEALRDYDVADLLARIGGLQLMPENGSHIVRLEALADAAACNPHAEGQHRISPRRFRSIIGQYLGSNNVLALQEDPCEEMFTEAFTFHGGSYLVLPGIEESITFILANLCKGLFLPMEPFPNVEMREQARLLVAATLVLSDEVARRAGLRRGLLPGQQTGEKGIVIPNSEELSRLAAAVMFEGQTLPGLMTSHGLPPAVLDPLMEDTGSLRMEDYSGPGSKLSIAPLRSTRNGVVVALPSMLLRALLHHLVSMAVRHGASAEVASSFRWTLWESVQQSLSIMGLHPLSSPPSLPSHDDSTFLEGFFHMDTDKCLYVQLVSDDLTGFDSDQPLTRWEATGLAERLRGRRDQVTKHVFAPGSFANDLLTLLVCQALGRPFAVALEEPARELGLEMLWFTAADLSTFARLEHKDRLALWKWAHHRRRIRERTRVMTVGQLYEYHLYRSCSHGYYVSDERQPDFIHIPPGGAGELRRQEYQRLDQHGASGYLRGSSVEVVRVYGPDIPVYLPLHLTFTTERAAILVEECGIPIWIVGPEYKTHDESRHHRLYVVATDLIAYWIWQFTPSLGLALEPLAAMSEDLVINVELATPDEWYREEAAQRGWASTEEDTHIGFEVDAERMSLSLEFEPTVIGLLMREDNDGERRIMAVVLSAIKSLLDRLHAPTAARLNEVTIAQIIDLHAPLGVKKKALALNLQGNPMLDELPVAFRSVQEADVQQLLDEIGAYVASTGWPEGGDSSDPRVRHELANNVVGYLYGLLERLVATLDPVGLMDYLLVFYEAITRELHYRRLTTPARLACFLEEKDLRKEIEAEMPEIGTAATTLRFLVEYVAARPPKGFRPISMEVYDRLMAIASQLIDWASISDLIKYQLAEVGLEILRSGRLWCDRSGYVGARRQYLSEQAAAEIRQRARAFGAHWEDPSAGITNSDAAEGPDLGDIDEAFADEFGLSVVEFGLVLGQVYGFGEGQDTVVKTAEMNHLVERVVAGAGLNESTVRRFLDLLTLGPRPDFLDPGPGFERPDVYPWRFNRAMSYMRRPIIRVDTSDGCRVVWGNLHLWHAVQYLDDLIHCGRLKARSPKMKAFISVERNRAGKAFNDEVRDQFLSVTAVVVRDRVKKLGSTRLRDVGGDLGDIDVFAVNTVAGEMLLIDCKNLDAARTPAEMRNELIGLFIGTDNREPIVKRMQRRARWVEENTDLVVRKLKLPVRSDWRIVPIVVVSDELMSPYLRSSPVPVLSFHRFVADFLPRWLPQ